MIEPPTQFTKRHVRFYVERPSGYMSSYYFRDALRDVRNRMKYQGRHDPIYMQVMIKLPWIPFKLAPRKYK